MCDLHIATTRQIRFTCGRGFSRTQAGKATALAQINSCPKRTSTRIDVQITAATVWLVLVRVAALAIEVPKQRCSQHLKVRSRNQLLSGSYWRRRGERLCDYIALNPLAARNLTSPSRAMSSKQCGMSTHVSQQSPPSISCKNKQARDAVRHRPSSMLTAAHRNREPRSTSSSNLV